jgi:hypothetical protein
MLFDRQRHISPVDDSRIHAHLLAKPNLNLLCLPHPPLVDTTTAMVANPNKTTAVRHHSRTTVVHHHKIMAGLRLVWTVIREVGHHQVDSVVVGMVRRLHKATPMVV